jgi:6-phosphogluconolactonase
MRLEVLESAELAAARAAALIAQYLREVLAGRAMATLALSGGATPVRMFRRLADEDLAWSRLHLFQVDERMVAAGDPRRNAAMLARLAADVSMPPERLHAMPVECEDPAAGARAYAQTLEQVAAQPPVLDVVHLGLGEDGHTASLVPGDAASIESLADVVVTAPYRGTPRMTLTLGALNRAGHRVWLVTGRAKRTVLERLLSGDATLVAARVERARSVMVADRDAAGDADG